MAAAESRAMFKGGFDSIMAKAQKSHHRYREDMKEMPDWMKKKKCPNRDRYLAGQRILPKNLTGKEKLPDIVDEVFLAYNSARLKEGCKLFVEKMLEPDVTVGMTISGAHPGRVRVLLHRSPYQSRVCGLDCLDRRQFVSRPAFCLELSGACRKLHHGRHGTAR